LLGRGEPKYSLIIYLKESNQERERENQESKNTKREQNTHGNNGTN